MEDSTDRKQKVLKAKKILQNQGQNNKTVKKRKAENSTDDRNQKILKTKKNLKNYFCENFHDINLVGLEL